MATIHFDGSDDQVSTVSTKALNGPLTLAAMFRRRAINNSSGEALIGVRDGNTAFYIDPGNKIAYYNGGPSLGPLVNNTTDWYIGVVTMTPVSGSWTPRFHLKNLTTDSAWVHVDGSVARTAIPITSLGQTVRVGLCTSVTLNINADIGLVAWWEAALTDIQAEALSANKRTSDWGAAPAPAVLSELNTLTPVDLEGNAATLTVTGSPVLDGTNPPVWNFNGLTAPPVADFSGTPLAGGPPLSVAFTDLSTGMG